MNLTCKTVTQFDVVQVEHGVHYLTHCCVTAVSALQNILSKDKSEQILFLFFE